MTSRSEVRNLERLRSLAVFDCGSRNMILLAVDSSSSEERGHCQQKSKTENRIVCGINHMKPPFSVLKEGLFIGVEGYKRGLLNDACFPGP